MHQKDVKLMNTIATLASIPQFFTLLNSLIRRNQSALDGDHLSFIFTHTNLLDLGNKLLVARKIVLAINSESCRRTYRRDAGDYEERSAAEYPMVQSEHDTERVRLDRADTWKSFYLFSTGMRDAEGEGTERASQQQCMRCSVEALHLFQCVEESFCLTCYTLTRLTAHFHAVRCHIALYCTVIFHTILYNTLLYYTTSH